MFHGIGDRSLAGSLETVGVSIVSVNGKSSIPLAHAILSSIGVPVYALFDADSGFEARAIANGKAQDKIESERTSHAKPNRLLLKYFDLPEEDFPSATVADEVAVFEDHLESFLAGNWPEWFIACESVEVETGIQLSKNQLAYRTATLRAEGDVPEVLLQILAKAKGE